MKFRTLGCRAAGPPAPEPRARDRLLDGQPRQLAVGGGGHGAGGEEARLGRACVQRVVGRREPGGPDLGGRDERRALPASTNLTVLVDFNNVQIDGHMRDVMDVRDLRAKYEAFGWHAVDVDGHDVDAVHDALLAAKAETRRPSALICHTVLGKGVSFMEDQPGWHGSPPSDERGGDGAGGAGLIRALGLSGSIGRGLLQRTFEEVANAQLLGPASHVLEIEPSTLHPEDAEHVLPLPL
jgi:hypothetical protein